MRRLRILALIFASAAALCLVCLRPAATQSPLRRITNTGDEGISISPSVSGDGRFIAFESTEDIAGAGGSDYFRALRGNISVDPPTFFQMGRTRTVPGAISQDGSRIAFASKDNPLGSNADGNSEIFLFNGSNLVQVTNTTPADIASRVTQGNFLPSISDDGRFIAFSSNRNLTSQNADGNLEIFVLDATANTFSQLTNTTGTAGATDAKISGNGTKVAFIRDGGATPSARKDLMLQDRVSGPATVIANQVLTLLMTYGRAISDDGTRVVYSGETAANSSQVFFYDGRGGNVLRQVTSLGVRVTEVPLHATISGDGKRIAFASRRAVTGFTNSDASVELYTYDIPTTSFARVTNAPGEADCFDGGNVACEVMSSLNDDGTTVVFNFPRALSGAVASGLENRSEIYATGTAVRPPFGSLTTLNHASFGHEPNPVKAVAPNSIAVGLGTSLANTTQQSEKLPNGTFPTNVAGTTVTVNGRSAQIFFVSPTQVQFLVPPQTELGPAEVVVTNVDGFGSRGTVQVFNASPGIFTKTGDGLGQGMILNSDTLQEGPFDPSGGGLRLLIYTTGARNAATTTVNIAGRVINAQSVLASPDMPGLDEVRVIVPADLRGAGTVNLSIRSDFLDSNPVTLSFTGDPSRNIQVNEVLADPPDGIAGDANHDGTRDGTDDEFIELVNASNETIGMGGWTIKTRAIGSSTESTRFTFASGTSLPPGEAIVVFGGGTANFNPSDNVFGCAQVFRVSASSGLSLTNAGLTVIVRDGNGNQITTFSYGSSSGLDGDNNQSMTRSPDVTGTFVQHTAASGAGGRRYSPGLKVDGTPFANCPAVLTTITLTPPSATINVGQTQQFQAQAFDQFGRPMPNVPITFKSDNTDNPPVAIIDSVTTDSAGVATASISAHNPGITHITATAIDGSVTLVSSPPATLTVTGPSLSINDVSHAEGDEESSIFTFTVSLSAPATGPVTFDIATQDNTATVADNDYVPRSLTAQTIPAGQQFYTFDVTVNPDGNIEQNETFFVNVSNVSGASVADGQGLGTIVTDDSPVLSVDDISMTEGDSGTKTFTFTITSTKPAPAPGITFDIATADGTAQDDNPASEDNDYVANSATGVTISTGNTTATFNVTVNGDTFVEPNETFFVNLTNVSSNAILGDGQGLGTIVNDDASQVNISQIYGGGGNSGATYKNDFVELFNRGATSVDIAGWSVQQASATGTSWSVTQLCPIGPCLLAPGKYFLVQMATGGATGANLPAPDATGTSNLSVTAGKIALVNNPSSLSGGSGCPFSAAIVDFVGYGTTADCSENNTDAPAHSNTSADFRKSGGCVDTNDNAADFLTSTPNPRNSGSPANDCSTGFRPDISINNVSVTEGNSGTSTVDFTVSLSAPNPTQTVTVNFVTADGSASAGSDYQTNSGTVTFSPGDTSEPVTITITGDTSLESNETFFVNLSNAVNASILDPQGVGTILEDDSPPTLTINDVSQNEGNSGPTTFAFTVHLSTPALTGGVTFNIATADGTAQDGNESGEDFDYVGQSLTAQTIPAGSQDYVFNVTVNGDANIEPNETFSVNVTSVSGATVGDGTGLGTIQTDDSPVLSINDVSANETDSGTTTFTFTVTSTLPAPAGGITFDIATADGTAQDHNPVSEDNDYVAHSITGQTIAAGNTSTTFDVTVNGDMLVEPNETFLVNISNAVNALIGDGTGQGTIQNDDTATLVVSQAYPGGGLTGATYKNDFIELFNRGTTTVNFSVTNYSVQFLSVGGSTWAKTDLTSGTLAPGQYFLVQETGGATGANLPTPDATGTLNLTSTTAGKVALVSNTTLLAGNCPGDDGTQPFNPTNVVDFVGYGGTAATANHCYEGSGPSSFTLSNNTIADFRKLGGCQDTNDNATDFTTATPNPRNTSSTLNDCSAADLTITKTDSPDPVTVGSNITYTITVLNNGPATAQSVQVTDNLPSEVTFVSCSATGGAVCGGSGNNRAVSLTSLASGASFTVTLVATANGPAGTTTSNTASVSSTTTDANSSDNSATATTLMQAPTASLSINDVTASEGNSGTTTFTFTISSSLPAPAGGITFDIATADGTAQDDNPVSEDNDYVANSVTGKTITAGNTSTTFDVTINGDTLVEANETFFVNISNAVNANIGDGAGQGTIQNDDTASLVISQVYGGGNNSGAPFQNDFVEIYNRGATTVDFSVTPYSVQYASVGSNFGSSKTNLTTGTIAPGKYFLVQESGGTTNGDPLPTPDATGTIAMAATTGKVALVAGTAALTSAACPGDDGVSPFNAADGAIADLVGYGGNAATVGHCYEGSGPAAAPGNTTSDIRKGGGCVDTNDNSADFFVHAPVPRNSSTPANVCSGQTADIVINDVTISELDSETIEATFTVSLISASASTVTVDYATNNGTATAPDDYTAISTTQLSFSPGVTSLPVTVFINDDTIDEPDETFFVNLSNPSNAAILDNQGKGTIVDNDVPPTLTINDVSLNEGNSGPTTFAFMVHLSAPALTGGVTFDIATADGTAQDGNPGGEDNDYVGQSLTSQTIPAGSQDYTFNVTVNGDTNNEPNETFAVSVTGVSGAIVGDGTAQGTIQNDDSPTLSINDVTISEGNSGTTTFTFTISSSLPAPAGGITFDIATADGTAQDDNPVSEDNDYVASSVTGKTITAGNTSTTFDVTVNGDTLVENNETFTVNLTNPTNATIGDSQGVGTINNDDTPLLVISQVYGGGSNAGAAFASDFVQLFNRGTTTINFSITPYSVQYASSAGTFSAANKVDLTTGTLVPGQYFLIRLAPASPSVGTPITADVTNTGINMSATDGKVALVLGTTVATTTAGCPTGVTIADLLGYGSANCAEGSATAVLSATKVAVRNASGCTDTNANSADFTVTTVNTLSPVPKNSSAAPSPCP